MFWVYPINAGRAKEAKELRSRWEAKFDDFT